MRLGKSPRCQSCTSALVSGAASGLHLVSFRAVLQVMHLSVEINLEGDLRVLFPLFLRRANEFQSTPFWVASTDATIPLPKRRQIRSGPPRCSLLIHVYRTNARVPRNRSETSFHPFLLLRHYTYFECLHEL
jgi:hypothetical protein